ncbi:dolichol kinase [Halobacteriales archaeon QS_3_64_16]|nr:MAG: dolichol kinase [Halobacteriales archaeon QS_3_64_16]
MAGDTTDEIARRLVHVSGLVFPLSYLLGVLSWRQLGWVLTATALAAFALEVFRLRVGLDWALLDRVFDHLTREYEQDNLAGYFLYLFSMAVVALLFAPRAAIPGMLMLAIADPVSGLLGSSELQAAKQTFVLLVTFGISVFLASLFVPPVPATLGGLAATLADGVKPAPWGYVIDDNLSIPIAAALAIEIGLLLPIGL